MMQRERERERQPWEWALSGFGPGRPGMTPEELADAEREYDRWLDELEAQAREAEANGDNDRW